MFFADKLKDYEILDTGDGMKLERWGGITLARPDPQTIWPKQRPELWRKADALYHRSSKGGGAWQFNTKLPERWTVGYGPLKFYVRPTGFKHTGLFPEQSSISSRTRAARRWRVPRSGQAWFMSIQPNQWWDGRGKTQLFPSSPTGLYDGL